MQSLQFQYKLTLEDVAISATGLESPASLENEKGKKESIPTEKPEDDDVERYMALKCCRLSKPVSDQKSGNVQLLVHLVKYIMENDQIIEKFIDLAESLLTTISTEKEKLYKELNKCLKNKETLAKNPPKSNKSLAKVLIKKLTVEEQANTLS